MQFVIQILLLWLHSQQGELYSGPQYNDKAAALRVQRQVATGQQAVANK